MGNTEKCIIEVTVHIQTILLERTGSVEAPLLSNFSSYNQ